MNAYRARVESNQSLWAENYLVLAKSMTGAIGKVLKRAQADCEEGLAVTSLIRENVQVVR